MMLHRCNESISSEEEEQFVIQLWGKYGVITVKKAMCFGEEKLLCDI